MIHSLLGKIERNHHRHISTNISTLSSILKHFTHFDMWKIRIMSHVVSVVFIVCHPYIYNRSSMKITSVWLFHIFDVFIYLISRRIRHPINNSWTNHWNWSKSNIYFVWVRVCVCPSDIHIMNLFSKLTLCFQTIPESSPKTKFIIYWAPTWPPLIWIRTPPHWRIRPPKLYKPNKSNVPVHTHNTTFTSTKWNKTHTNKIPPHRIS